MEHEPKKLKASTSETQVDSKLDLDALLHPATAFARPLDVVRDPDLTFNEKRLVTRDNNGATTLWPLIPANDNDPPEPPPAASLCVLRDAASTAAVIALARSQATRAFAHAA